jgi:bifunctional non-homologous end joining protein LigD
MGELLNRMSDAGKNQAVETDMPHWMDPMLARLTHDYFTDEDWYFERKLDGERAISYIRPDGGVHLMSRNQKHLNDQYPELERALEKHALSGCILDGEVVALDEDGVSDFEALQPRMQVSSREEAEQSDVKVYYYLFDCLYADGHDITPCALHERKKILKAIIDYGDPLRLIEYRIADNLDYYREACKKGWEGLIAKDLNGRYEHGRSSKWLKFKCVTQQEFVIGGFTDPHGERIGFGALLIGFYREGDLVYAGKVGTGFNDDTLKYLRNRFNRIERKTSPFNQGDSPLKEVHFMTPEMVCEVAFTEWTDNDKLRHPRYKGLRNDKDAHDVHKEIESQAADLSST